MKCNACGIPRFGRDGHEDTEPATIAEKQAHRARRTPFERMNKSEAAVLMMLMEKYPGALVLPQCRILPFDDGTSYRPDFEVVGTGRKAIIVEVKGGYRGMGYEGGMERYRRARDQYRSWFKFQLWQKKGGKWEVE